MRAYWAFMAIALSLFFVACINDNDSAELDSSVLDSGADTNTATESDTNPQGDFWVDGYCGDCQNEVPASLDCNGIGLEGCCDDQGRNIWCEQELLWCRDCAAEQMFCSWMESYYGLAYYNCDAVDWGPDTSGQFPEDCDEVSGDDAGPHDAGQ
jgi:hypothetical protein